MERIGKYQILGQIGQGAMGVVYKALDPFIERVVAVKTMSADLDADPEVRARFFREARSAGQLSHKNIVTIYDLGEEGGKAYMAMEFLDGEDLKDIIGRRDSLPLERKLKLMRDLLEGLGHAHKRQVIHRDIKPGNIHITRSGELKILDFGLARITSSDITRAGSVMGTPNYMSPEQIRSENVDHRSDIFSAGATFYELLTYRKPFYSNSLPSTFFKILQQDPEPVETVAPGIPAEFSAVLQRAMAKDAAKRYQDVEEMIRDLESLSRLLEEREKTVRQETGQTLGEIERLVNETGPLLEAEALQLRRSGLMTVPLSVTNAPGDPEATQLGESGGGYLGALALRERARNELGRLRELLQQRRQAELLFGEALELERQGDYEGALRTSDLVIAADPAHAQAPALIERVKRTLLERVAAEVQEAASRIDRLVAEHPFLREHLEEVAGPGPLQGQPADPDATQVDGAAMLERRDWARRQYDRLAALLQRRRDLDERIRQAAECESQGRLAESLAALESVLQEEPTDREALAALGRVRARIEEEDRRRRAEEEAEQLLAKAGTRFEQSDYASALGLLESALALAPQHARVVDLVKKTRQRLDEQAERAHQTLQAREALEVGRRALEAGDVARARKQLSAALAHDSRIEGAAALADDIALFEDRLRAQKERQARIDGLAESVREAIRSGDDREAARRLESLIPLDPDPGEAGALRVAVEQARARREAREEETRERIAATLARGAEARAAGDFETAIRLARSVLAEDGSQAAAAELLQQGERDRELQRRRQELEREVQEVLKRAEAKASSGDLPGAVAILEGVAPQVLAVQEVGAALEACRDDLRRENETRARAELQRRERVAGALALCRAAMAGSEFEKAAEHARAALVEDPASVEAADLLQTARRQLDLRRRREELERRGADLVQRAGALAAQKGPAAAVSLLEQAEAGLAALPAVRQALEQYSASLRLQREAEARDAEVRRQLENAKKAFGRGDIDACLRAAESVLRLEPTQADALDLRSRANALAAERKAEEGRRAQSAEALREAERELHGSRFHAARQAVDKALGLWPGNLDAQRTRLDIDRREADFAERTRREDAARSSLAGADDMLAGGDLDGARRALAAAVSAWAGVPGAVALRKRIEKQARAARKGAIPSSSHLLRYAGVGVAGALLVFGLMYFRSGASSPEPRSQVVPPVLPRSLPPPAAKPRPATVTPAARNAPVEETGQEGAAALAAQVARGNRAARRLYQAGRYDDAEKSVSGVLAIAPADREANALLAQLGRIAREGAEAALSRMGEAKARADSAGAGASVPQSYAAAQEAENDALRFYQAREYGKAATKMSEAAGLYRAAEAGAAAAHADEQERARSAERAAAERSRIGFEQARAKVVATGADRKAGDAFRDAAELAGQGQAKMERGDFGGSRAAYDSAAAAMLRAGEAGTADQREWDGLRNSNDVPALQAFAKKYPGSALAEQAKRRIEQLDWEAVDKKDLVALKGFLQKHGDGSYARQATAEIGRLEQANGVAADRQAVRQALARYAAAYDRMDARALQEAWPAIPRDTLDTISSSFKNARSMRMELRPRRGTGHHQRDRRRFMPAADLPDLRQKAAGGPGPDHGAAAPQGWFLGHRLDSIMVQA